ncbi:MAG TPA: DUF1569 domain-containing protein [Planctomycetota bacterium]|nr:DUF1569 domain-containing protein [Planctomycetota bacterium]
MDSLLDPQGNAAAIARIQALRADATRVWGKMNVVHMLVHCQRTFQTAVGELELKRSMLGRLLGGWARRKYVEGSATFSRNGPTDPAFRVTDAKDFERQRLELIRLVQRFAEPGAITSKPHSFFGPMTREHWDRLMVKHLDHHLRQFGV